MSDNRIRTPWGRVPLDLADLEQLSADLTRARELRDFDALNICTQRLEVHYEAALVLGIDAETASLTAVTPVCSYFQKRNLGDSENQV